MSEYILCVDDDENILKGFRRQLRGQFELETATSGQEGLELFKRKGPFAVVVSDMRMPMMDGIEFLSRVREANPDSVRIMLTGNADMQTAIDAVNEGNIFRFLTKPCSSDELAKAINAGIEQYRLINAERELLQKTLTGSIKMLTDILSMVNPAAFSRASRLRRLVGRLAAEMKLPNLWQYELAAMLSQVGCLTLLPETLERLNHGERLSADEQRMFVTHPAVGSKLLSNIPRLQSVAKMVEKQLSPCSEFGHEVELARQPNTQIGAQMLRVVIDYDQLVSSGMDHRGALVTLSAKPDIYQARLVDLLENIVQAEDAQPAANCVHELAISELKAGMITYDDIIAQNGVMLVPKGQEISFPLLVRLHAFSRHVGVAEPVRVVMPPQMLIESPAAVK